VIPAGEYFVLGVNGDTETNGGMTIGYDYGNFNLANQDDEIILKSGETEVDVVAYDDGVTFPDAKGVSLSLSPAKINATDNDLAENWCDAVTPYADADLGTPGEANPECPFCGDNECNGGENCGTCEGDCACGEGSECLDNNCIDLTPEGGSCGQNEDCASGFCVDLVCCDSACDGECEGCAVSGTKGQCVPFWGDTDPEEECPLCQVCNGSGACKFVAAGLDIKESCSSQAQITCAYDGTCDGAGQCAFYAEGTMCDEASCGGTTFYPANECDGVGVCEEPDSVSCCPYVCDGAQAACLSSCVSDDECCDGLTCVDNACVN